MPFCSIELPSGEQSLRAAKKLTGLPSLAFLDADGEVLLALRGPRDTVADLRRGLGRAERYVRLRALAADGDAAAEVAFLLMQLEEGQLGHADAVRRRRALTAGTAAQLAAIDRHLLDLEVAEAVRSKGQQGRHELGPRFLAMLRDSPRPSPKVTRGFWFAILEWAERERDAKAFAAGLEGMREALAVTDPEATWVAPLLQRYEQKLEELERGR